MGEKGDEKAGRSQERRGCAWVLEEDRGKGMAPFMPRMMCAYV